VAGKIDSSGDIEIICENIEKIQPNGMARFVFRVWDDCSPPYRLKVTSPSGNLIVDRVIRVLPTGEPQSPAPVTFAVQPGVYHMHVSQLRGQSAGEATLHVTER
jgi:hypothetical protein